jgi:hypothetical protein
VPITPDELCELGKHYGAGETLWRVPLPHFTPWDMNWPYGPPPGYCSPDGDPECLPPDPYEHPRVDNPKLTCGSLLECQNQTLGETVPLVGAGFDLNYRSDRAPDRKDAYRLEIPLVKPPPHSPPASLYGIEAVVHVAGRVFSRGSAATRRRTARRCLRGISTSGTGRTSTDE